LYNILLKQYLVNVKLCFLEEVQRLSDSVKLMWLLTGD